jgi:hypothetical protein
VIVSGTFNQLFRPGLRADFRDEYLQFSPEYPLYLKTTTTDLPETSATIITGLSRMLERADGEPVVYEDPQMGPRVVVVDKEFGLGFIISKRTVEDDQYGKANQAAKWLAHAARMTSEYRSASFLDDAFTGATFKGIDGLSVCSTAHTLINSQKTFANTPAAPIGFGVAGVTALFDLAQQAVDQNGDPIIVNIDTVVIGNNAGDYHRAVQIFNSEKEPFTTENQDNAIRMRLPQPKLVISHYKQSFKSYFMIDSRLNDAQYIVRRPIDFSDTFDFDTDAAKFKATMRFALWHVDPIGWFGSNPT